MKEINVMLKMGSAATTYYIPVPRKCTIVSAKASPNGSLTAAKTIDLQRTSTSVNKITVGASGAAAGAVVTGVADSSNSELAFDPAASTATQKVIKAVLQASLAASGVMIGLNIQLDELALNTQ